MITKMNSQVKVSMLDNNNYYKNSSVELLKIIAMILIVIDHVQTNVYNNTFGYNPAEVTGSSETLIMNIFNCFGNIGNGIFIFCSCWFLVDSYKLNIYKIKDIVIDNWLISFIFLLVHILINVPGSISYKEAYYSILPTISGVNWFVTCYLLFYTIHPCLKLVIDNMTEGQLSTAMCLLVLLYGVAQIFPGGGIFYYSPLMGFITYFFLVAYLKKYFKELTRAKYLLIAIACFLSIVLGYVLVNYLGLKIGALSNQLQRFNIFTNPIIIVLSYSLFMLFWKMKLNNSKMINGISRCSLLIFIIHNNYFVKTYDRSIYYDFVYQKLGIPHGLISGFIGCVITYLSSLGIAISYLNLKRFLQKYICLKIERKILRRH